MIPESKQTSSGYKSLNLSSDDNLTIHVQYRGRHYSSLEFLSFVSHADKDFLMNIAEQFEKARGLLEKNPEWNTIHDYLIQQINTKEQELIKTMKNHFEFSDYTESFLLQRKALEGLPNEQLIIQEPWGERLVDLSFLLDNFVESLKRLNDVNSTSADWIEGSTLLKAYTNEILAKYFQSETSDVQATVLKMESLKYYSSRQIIQFYLNEAIKLNLFEVAAKLIDAGASMNSGDLFNCTPLMTAIINNNIEAIKFCFSYPVDTNTKSITGENLLHIAAKTSSREVLEFLLQRGSEVKNLQNERSFYGNTPLQVAILYGHEPAVRLLSENETADVAMIPGFGVKPTIIDQEKILEKLRHYLISHNRDLTLLPEKGHCNGFAFLATYYISRGKGDEYFHLLRLISEWDGTQESLLDDKAKREAINFSGDYSNLEEVIEHFINDLVWFQHSIETNVIVDYDKLEANLVSSLTGLAQHDRQEMYEIVKKDTASSLKMISAPKTISLANASAIKTFLDEMISKPGCIIEFGGGNHTTTGWVTDNHTIKYYDPNVPYELTEFSSTAELAEFIMIFKYILLDKPFRECELIAYKFVAD